MRIAIISINPSFVWQFSPELAKHHILRHFYPLNLTDPANYVVLGKLCQWADLIFVEFAQTPLEYIVAYFSSKHIVVRVARIEIYNENLYLLDWNAVDLAIFCSEHVKQRFHEKLEAVNRKRGLVVNRPIQSVFIPGNMYDPEAFNWVERKFEKPYKIGIVGNIVPKKRQYDLIQMFAELPRFFRLDIVGKPILEGYGNYEYTQNILDLIDTLDLKDRVKLLGEIPYNKMPDFYKTHDVVVSNSNEEGDALNITEGAACGCYPLISCWRGAAEHYSPQYVFDTPKEFVERLVWWSVQLSQKEKLDLSKKVAKDVEKFKMQPLAEKIRSMLENINDGNKIQMHYDHTVEEDIYQGRNQRIIETEKWITQYIKPGMKVLSLGCGIGLLEESLANIAAEVFGVDLSSSKIEEAKKRTPGKKNLLFTQGDAKIRSSRSDSYYDVVIMVDFLEHIPLEDQQKVLDNVNKWARKDKGLAIVTIPLPTAPRGGRVPQPIDEAVNPEDLIQAFARNGFPKVVEKTPCLDIYYRLVVSR